MAMKLSTKVLSSLVLFPLSFNANKIILESLPWEQKTTNPFWMKDTLSLLLFLVAGTPWGNDSLGVWFGGNNWSIDLRHWNPSQAWPGILH